LFVKDDSYDASTYGDYPVQRYKSTSIVSPRMNVLQSNSECRSDLYTLITPRGWAVPEASATILDQEGRLVWSIGGYEQIYNLMVQKYLGQQYLTFWAGNDAVGGHGAGFYYMVSSQNRKLQCSIEHKQLDTSYREIFKIPAAGGLDADLHDFVITEDGTALMTVYEIITADLSSLGKSTQGRLWDCLIQEVDLSTGILLFQWRASEHYAVTDSYRDIGDDGVWGKAFDFFHINSIDKDDKGNYLVSSRYMHTVTYISADTGQIVWVLGGKRNMFTDLSNGKATNFAYQHDARWNQDFTTVSLFDNSIDDAHTDIAPYTRGIRIKVDQEQMTAELLVEYINPHQIKSVSQGSLQILSNGNVFMGYGNSAAFTEYASNGTVLCDVHFGPENGFGGGSVQSYRAHKSEWHGWPTSPPSVTILQNAIGDWNLYVSWNGATEVSAWILQGAVDSEAPEDTWTDLEYIPKSEFETRFPISQVYPQYLRVLGVDAKDMVLGVSSPLDTLEEKVCSPIPLPNPRFMSNGLRFGVCHPSGSPKAIRGR
jgi:hypothetical protein